METTLNEIIFDGGNDSDDVLEQFITSNYHENNQLNVAKFLDEDRTIDLEKLELGIILIIEYLENSVKIETPIYINLGNMQEYFSLRHITDRVDRITEECQFILGFCQAIADEYKMDREIIVRFRGNNE